MTKNLFFSLFSDLIMTFKNLHSGDLEPSEDPFNDFLSSAEGRGSDILLTYIPTFPQKHSFNFEFETLNVAVN